MIYAFVLWIVFIAIWRLVMPDEARGRNWNYAHMAVPGIALALYALTPVGLADPIGIWLWGGVAMFVLASAGWSIGMALRNHSIMDVVYPCISFGIAVTTVLLASDAITLRLAVVLGLMAIWMVRMLRHAFGTNFDTEQQPYATHRIRFGARWPVWSFFAVYMLQGILIWIWVMPFAFAASADVVGLQLTDWIGIVIWLVGFFFLVVGDSQMNAFKADPANKGGIMDRGLWSMTRHPNYFGERWYISATSYSPCHIRGVGSASSHRSTQPGSWDGDRRHPAMNATCAKPAARPGTRTRPVCQCFFRACRVANRAA